MWPPGNAVRQPAAGAAGGVPGGPAMTAVWSVAARIARTVRCIAIAYIVVQVLIWHAFYAADPWRLAGPAAAVGWGAAIVIYLRRRWPSWQLAALDAGFYIVLALSAGWCVPPAMRGDAANWLFIAMQSQLMVPAWFASLALSAPLAVGMGVAYWAGVMIFPPPGSGGNFPVAPAALLVAVAAAHRCGRRMLYRRAARADVALARADSDARAQYVVLSRNIERRENGRLLHDTVLNTLTALARASSGDAAEVVGRCQHDVRLMEYVLSVRGDPAPEAARAYGGMIAAIEATAVEMRARGLDVHVQHSRRQPVPASTARPGTAMPGSPGAGRRGDRSRRAGGAGQRHQPRRHGRGLGRCLPGGARRRRRGHRRHPGDRAGRGRRVRPRPRRSGPAGLAEFHHRAHRRLGRTRVDPVGTGRGHRGEPVLARTSTGRIGTAGWHRPDWHRRGWSRPN